MFYILDLLTMILAFMPIALLQKQGFKAISADLETLNAATLTVDRKLCIGFSRLVPLMTETFSTYQCQQEIFSQHVVDLW